VRSVWLARQRRKCGPALSVSRGDDGGDQDAGNVDEHVALDAIHLFRAVESARSGYTTQLEVTGVFIVVEAACR
jgi:hypothetical protein